MPSGWLGNGDVIFAHQLDHTLQVVLNVAAKLLAWGWKQSLPAIQKYGMFCKGK